MVEPIDMIIGDKILVLDNILFGTSGMSECILREK
jgi:hypothetical protein